MLNIEVLNSDRPIIARMKKSLLAKFRPNSENDIEQAIRLAHFLLTIGELDSSRNLLESFLYFDISEREEKYEHLWFWNSFGIILLAYLEKTSGNNQKYEKLIGIVEASQYFQADSPEYYFEDLSYHHEEFDFHIKDYLNETHKFRCQILSQLFINYLFFVVMSELTLASDRQKREYELIKVNERISNLSVLLKEELLNQK